MKKLIVFLILFFWWTSNSIAENTVTEVGWNYSTVLHWKYSLNVDVVILMPDDFIEARNYYFDKDKYSDRDRIVAFTVWHIINGEDKPIMFVKVRTNLAPSNNDIGHEIKHIINWKHREMFGVNRFMLPCDDWK